MKSYIEVKQEYVQVFYENRKAALMMILPRPCLRIALVIGATVPCYLKKMMNAMNIECIFRMDSDYKRWPHDRNADFLAFLRKNFGRK